MNARELHGRTSRTELDFEQALRAEGTVLLKEGFDVNSMGEDMSPARGSLSTMSNDTHTPRLQPATPVVVPPTPSPTAGPSSARLPAPSPSSSSNDLAFDPDDSDHQTKRRSMYRSPGTSSSPDLATLLRKAKERGGVIGTHHKREKRRESPPPMPRVFDRSPATTRQRPSTSSQAMPLSKSKTSTTSSLTHDNSRSPAPSEWIMTSPRSRNAPQESGSAIKPKASVRSKTTAFLGKMLGQGTVRERSKTDAAIHKTPPSHPHPSPSLIDVFAAPVPQHVAVPNSPTGSPIADVFSQMRPSEKPLPPIFSGDRETDSLEEQSIVLIDAPSARSPSPITPVRKRPVDSVNAANRNRRSMSVGEFELKNAIGSTSSVAPLPRNTDTTRPETGSSWEDSALTGILSEFKGQLSQLDPTIPSSLDLHDPSTPSRRAGLGRAKTDPSPSVADASEAESPGRLTSSAGPSTPTVVIQPAHPELEKPHRPLINTTLSIVPPIVPPRSSSLQASQKNSGQASPRLATSPRTASSPLRSRATNGTGTSAFLPPRGDSSRLRAQHRSTASSSEPSLIPAGSEARVREHTRSIRLIPSLSSVLSADAVSSAHMAGSQQDLTTSDLHLHRFPSDLSKGIGEDSSDMETRGKELASRCWAEDEEFLAKEKIAEWLGGLGRINKIALHHYINFFDFQNLRLDMAFRRLCSKLYLKAETQQVDRILEEFSRRYWECNPGGLYGSAGVVHAVSYSLLLLNTDLHVADLTSRMSRSQFARNTLSAIQMQLQPVVRMSTSDVNDDSSSRHAESTTETVSRSKRSDSITSWNSISREAVMYAVGQPANGSTPSVQTTYSEHKPYGRTWESDMENLLKEMYSAIKNQQILQPLGSGLVRSSLSSLSPGQPMARNRSLRGPPDRLATLKRGSIRGLQSIIGAQANVSPYSSNSSIDGRASPSPSFATSTHEAMYSSSSSFLAPTLGFASNLSHTIIREAQEDDDRSVHSEESGSTSISITDEELALLGPPWAKEGMLCRKQFWESDGKRAKDKAWLDVFVVIQKGELNMFTFGARGGGGSGVVGGGNWLENASSVGSIHLAHTLAHSLPPPGYSRQRPYCMVLALSNGGVYFFQAGTEELVNEWVSTCNYWAARTSKEPLAGGVSNMEYGWNRVTDPFAHGRSASDTESNVDHSDNLSVRSSRSTRSKFGWRDGSSTVRAAHSPWVDRTYINDWKPPLPPTVSSIHDEEAQLEALQKHVSSMKKDLKRHNEYREPMMSLYQPRSANAAKAQTNWKAKSQYLLAEIVKYDSYIDSLQAAMSLRLKKRGEKALERALNGGNPEDEAKGLSKGKWKGPEEETIAEDEEPPATPAAQQFGSQLHRREVAEAGDDE